MRSQLDKVRAIVLEHGTRSRNRLDFWVEVIEAHEEGTTPHEVGAVIDKALDEWEDRHIINKKPEELLLIALDMLGKGQQ